MARQRAGGGPDDIKPADGFTPAASFGDDGVVATEDDGSAARIAALEAELNVLRRERATNHDRAAEADSLKKQLAAIEKERDIDHPLAKDPALKSPVAAADEILRLREQLAAARGPSYAAGQKYRVSIKDGPTAVVQCEGVEHPFEAFKRATGVISSMHGPEIHPAPEDAECGVCDHTGKVPEKK